jgi:hypothetical protein
MLACYLAFDVKYRAVRSSMIAIASADRHISTCIACSFARTRWAHWCRARRVGPASRAVACWGSGEDNTVAMVIAVRGAWAVGDAAVGRFPAFTASAVWGRLSSSARTVGIAIPRADRYNG